jgi:hypothetical protein
MFNCFVFGDLENDVSRVDGCDEIWGSARGRSGGAVSLRTVLVGSCLLRVENRKGF